MRPEQVTKVMHDLLSQELLHSAIPVRLAYNGKDGLPRAIPIGFLWKDERIVLCTSSNAYKVEALATNPKVALTIDTEAPYRALLVRGTAKAMTDEQQFRAFEAAVRSLYKQMARISIAPEWAKVLDFETRLPSTVEELLSPDDSAGSWMK
jgi:nitroimidazol reductase NimA-like FMN-containing flavoprotein (pyridoxamine 5'-phosphate oxidase superfamily)